MKPACKGLSQFDRSKIIPVFRIPGIDQRTAIVGRTGSGKTQGGAFILSQMPFDQMPFVILDFKREKLFNEIEGIRRIDLERPNFHLLNQPGLFLAQPSIGETQPVEDLLWHCWEQEYTGVFVDEGYMISKNRAYIALLTQGRSKNCPVISLTQRPAWITKFVFSEADYFMIFRLKLQSDRDIIESYIEAPIEKRLDPHWSYWYDATTEQLAVLRPVPSREVIQEEIRAKLEKLNQSRRAKQFV